MDSVELEKLKAEATAGDANAQHELGEMYWCSEGANTNTFHENNEQAAKWYRLAADQGHAGALYKMGVIYFNGRGAPKDREEGVRLLHLAADQGNSGGQYILARLYERGVGVPKDLKKADELLRLFNEADDV